MLPDGAAELVTGHRPVRLWRPGATRIHPAGRHAQGGSDAVVGRKRQQGERGAQEIDVLGAHHCEAGDERRERARRRHAGGQSLPGVDRPVRGPEARGRAARDTQRHTGGRPRARRRPGVEGRQRDRPAHPGDRQLRAGQRDRRRHRVSVRSGGGRGVRPARVADRQDDGGRGVLADRPHRQAPRQHRVPDELAQEGRGRTFRLRGGHRVGRARRQARVEQIRAQGRLRPPPASIETGPASIETGPEKNTKVKKKKNVPRSRSEK